MGTPTPQQIKTVQTNLQNMQAFNDYVHSYGQDKILNAYLLLSQTDGSDPGLAVGLNIVESALRVLGSQLGPIGAFAGSFMAGMVAIWASQTPPNLNGYFSSYITRFSATCQQVDLQLATYYQDPASYWDTTFTNPFTQQPATLGDLASGDFPAETDPAFETAAQAALFALDQNIWQYILVQAAWVTLWISTNGPDFEPGSQGDPPTQEVEGFIAANPAYDETWTWQQGSGGCGGSPSGWNINQYNLGFGAGQFHDGSISDDACAYLFQDSVPGVIINPSGLYPRATVFFNLGVRQTTQYVDLGAPTAEKVSTAYLRAVKEGRTLSALVAKHGRRHVEERLIAEARKDPRFARRLARQPRETVESFFDIKLPEIVGFHVIVEDQRSFGLVIPYPMYEEGAKP